MDGFFFLKTRIEVWHTKWHCSYYQTNTILKTLFSLWAWQALEHYSEIYCGVLLDDALNRYKVAFGNTWKYLFHKDARAQLSSASGSIIMFLLRSSDNSTNALCVSRAKRYAYNKIRDLLFRYFTPKLEIEQMNKVLGKI